MSEQTIGIMVTSLAGVFVALLTKTDILTRRHKALMKDIELYNALPPDSSSKKELLDSIDRRVKLASNTSRKRSPISIGLGVFFLLLGAYLTWYAIHAGSWWRLLLIVSISLLLLSIAGLADGFTKAERDSKGNKIKKN